MLGKYLRLWIMRAADNSVMLTDKLTILIVPFSTLVLWMTGTKMTESVQETLALGVAMTVVAVVLRSEEHTSELQSLMRISYAVFCLKKNRTTLIQQHIHHSHLHKL